MTNPTFTRKIGTNKGKPRLWIEGAALTAAGFKPGDRFDFYVNTNGEHIIAHWPDGKRKVSGKGEKPIIDITGSGLLGLDAFQRVALTCRPGAITIIPAA